MFTRDDWLSLYDSPEVQAFLAYCYDGQSTVYERVRAGGFQALMPPQDSDESPNVRVS